MYTDNTENSAQITDNCQKKQAQIFTISTWASTAENCKSTNYLQKKSNSPFCSALLIYVAETADKPRHLLKKII
jgi:hypothetical protein